MRTAVVGHVEYVTFGRVEQVPSSGDIVHARDVFEVPAGGGPVAAVQLRKLGGSCTFFTALGDDYWGHRARAELEAFGLRVQTTFRPEAQRRAFTHLDSSGERTITVMGARLGPHAADPLDWDELERCDAVYFCAGDDDALRQARRARVLVATTREGQRMARVAVPLDAAVGSASDPAERYTPFVPVPRLLVATAGRDGGTFAVDGGSREHFEASDVPGAVSDSYGAGDNFAGGLTFALGAGMSVRDALGFASWCGAASLTGRGPYEAQLSLT